MHVRNSTRRLRRLLPLVPIALYGCTDSPNPVAPRVDARPHALEAPVITVTNTADSGPGSLRQAISDASATPGTVIHFDPAVAGQTIVVASHLKVGTDMTIEGPAPQGITISGNLSTQVFEVGAGATVNMRNLSIVNGRETSGAGIEVIDGLVILDHALVANNQAAAVGGGVWLSDVTGQLVLVNSTISGNSAEKGGGIAGTGSMTIRNSTIAYNTAGIGGGLQVADRAITIRNSIIANNTDTDASTPLDANCAIAANASVLYSGRNLSSDTSCGDAGTLLIADPQLGPLAANGGPTMTHALGIQSAAIDAGTLCTETTDQRYVIRNQGASCDIGAFEFNDYGAYTITLGPNVAVNAKTGVITLTGAVRCSKPTTQLGLDVAVSQTQKTTGRFTTIIKADGFVGFTLCGPSPTSWSVSLTPPTGKFEAGSATGTASTGVYAPNFVPATVTSPLKVFQVK